MTRTTWLVGGVILVVAALCHGGLYQIVGAGSGGSGGSHDAEGQTGEAYASRLNKLTGSVALCTSQGLCVYSRLVYSPKIERAADQLENRP